MRVTIFANVDITLNPYIPLYKETLECQGLAVRLEREFSLNWLLTKAKSCDVIHLHWIEAAYKSFGWTARFRMVNKLINSRFGLVFQGILRLANFSLALLLAKVQGKIIVYTAHNLKANFKQFWPFIILSRIAHYVVLSLSDSVHVHNQYTRKMIERSYGRKKGVVVIPHGNYVGCYPNQISRIEARRQLSLPDDAFIYLFLGLIRPYKGVEDLIEAFEELKASMGRLLIVGRFFQASYREKILNLTQNNPTIKLVPEFIPNEAIQLYMNACDVYVLPYRDMTTSGAALLALSFGRPIVAPAIASFPEIITLETGILYDPVQPNALSSALGQAKQQSWSEAGIFDCVHQFDWDKLAPQLAALYQVKSGRRRELEAMRSSD